MPSYATLTGRIVVPGTTTGIPGELKATPLTEGGVLTLGADDYTTIGAAVADVTDDGVIEQEGTPGLNIPTEVVGVVWRIVFHPKGKGNLPVRLGDYEIIEDTDLADLVGITPLAISPTIALQIAQAAALGATNDTATASFVVDEDSATRAALAATLAPDVILSGPGIDPTGAADSTSALQAMIDANPGRRLRFPTGVFKFSTLTIDKGQSLYGSGWQDFRDRHVFFGNASWSNATSFNGTILRSTATSGIALTIFDTEVNTGSLGEFFLIGPGSGTSTGILLGGTVVTESVVHPVWNNIKVGNFATGVKMQWVNEGGFHDLTIHGCTVGLEFGDYVNQNAFTMLDLQRCGTALLMNATCAANAFYSPIAQVCGTGFVVSGQKTALFNPYVEGTTNPDPDGWGIDIAGGVGNAVHAPLLSGAGDGIRIRAGANDSTVTAFGYDGNSAQLANHGARSHLQGYFTGLLTDTGTSTTIIDAGYAGSPFGPRKTWTPTLDAAYGGGFVLGNGTVTGSYTIAGKTVTGSVEFTKGSTSTMAGLLRLLLPVNAASLASISSKVTMLTANGNFVGASLSDAVSNIIIGAVGTGGAQANLSASVPAFWSTGDKITIQFTYERA